MSLAGDARDLGRLQSYALRPKTRPGADGDYARLISRYLDDATFRTAFDALLDGLDSRVLHAGDLGLVLTTRRESVFAYRISGEAATWTKDKAKVLRGVAHLGIAAYAYPHPDDLHDPVVRYVDVVPLEAFIRRSLAQLRARADAVAEGAPDAHDAIVDLALAAGVNAAWSEWDRMHPAEVTQKGRGTGRISSRSATYWCLRALRDLVEHGLARQVGKDTDGRFQLLERFRHQVGAAAADAGYQALSTLRQTDDAAPDPRDPHGVVPLPGRPPEWGADPDSAEPANDDATPGAPVDLGPFDDTNRGIDDPGDLDGLGPDDVGPDDREPDNREQESA
jgi:hypothetical protein